MIDNIYDTKIHYLSNIIIDFNNIDDIDSCNLYEYDNLQLVTSLLYFVMNAYNLDNFDLNIAIINKFISHINDNKYNTPDFIKTEIYQVLILYNHILKNIIHDSIVKYIYNYKYIIDPIFNILFNSINWNLYLYTFMLKLLMIVDYFDCFEYFYNIASVTYIIDDYELFDYINTNICNKYIVLFRGEFKCLTIFKYLLSKYNSVIQVDIIRKYYINNSINISTNNYYVIFIDNYIDSIYIYLDDNSTNNNCLIYNFTDNESLNDISNKILLSLIKHNIHFNSEYDKCINLFNLKPYDFYYDAIINYNKKFIYHYINKQFELTSTEIFSILNKLATIEVYKIINKILLYKLLSKVINNLCQKKYLDKLSFDQINTIVQTGILNYNLYIIKKLFIYYTGPILEYFKYFKSSMIKLIFDHIDKFNINFNNPNIIHYYIVNNKLILYLIKHNLLNKNIITLIYQKILYNIDHTHIYNIYLIKKLIYSTDTIFDINLFNKFYSYNNSIASLYLDRCSEQFKLTYNDIKLKYKNLFNSKYFDKLLIKMTLTLNNAKELLSFIKKISLKNKIKYILKHIKNIDIE
jgi:hypothetical protein